MKRYKFITVAIALVGILFSTTSCGDDFLTADSAKKVPVGAPATEEVIFSNLTASYQILLRDNYASGYNSIFLISDLRSDDVYKGGESAGDQSALYSLATFTTSPSNSLGGLWQLYYKALARVNNAIMACDNAVEGSRPEVINRYKAEGLFLRAYYMHILWKNWGNIPFFTEPLQEPYVAPQYKADEIYAFIMADIKAAEDLNTLPMKTTGQELGRVNKAALYMLKARVVMYQNDESKYSEVADNMATIIKSGDYALFNDFGAMWLDENEWCVENIFETNHVPRGAEWGSSASNPYGFGTNLPCFISPSELEDPSGVYNSGWGFSPVRKHVWETLYEEGDTRREASVNNWLGFKYGDRFQDTGLYLGKYSARKGYNLYGTTDLNYCNNMRIFRFSETLLNYAELVGLKNAGEKQGVNAQDCFNQVRKRAFGKDAPLTLTQDNLELERHREFVGEGMRFWDVVRWGKGPQILTETVTETTPGGANRDPMVWSWSRTFTNEKKYLPIPQDDITTTEGTEYPLVQNPGW